jgi:HEAT repeat protein
VSARPLREEIVNALADRKEPEATDKLIEIAKSGTDPQVRRSAISALTRKGAKDPRTEKMLLELISGESSSRKP